MTQGGLKVATAFWSYAHSDDDGSDGQIRRLKEQVDHAFKRHSGEQLKSFFDRYGAPRLEWGDEWRSKINMTISGTTFFIAVLSPSYLKSANCQGEFLQFWEKARESDLEELLLPILWVNVYPETQTEHQIWEIAKEHQYIDWTSIRKLDEKLADYKALIDEMGERLADAARKVSTKPEVIPLDAESKVGAAGGDLTDGDAGVRPGYVDPDESLPLRLTLETGIHAHHLEIHLQEAAAALQQMNSGVSIEPLPAAASAGERLIYFR